MVAVQLVLESVASLTKKYFWKISGRLIHTVRNYVNYLSVDKAPSVSHAWGLLSRMRYDQTMNADLFPQLVDHLSALLWHPWRWVHPFGS